jgi:hypothetical protein
MEHTHKTSKDAGRSANSPPAAKQTAAETEFDNDGPHARRVLRKALWILVVLCWPLLNKILIADVLIQLLRALYFWSTPDVHAGWSFALHFGVLSGLTYFVAFGDPDQL